MRLMVYLIFTTALGTAGWMFGTNLGGLEVAQMLALAGIFLASMILMATRTKPL